MQLSEMACGILDLFRATHRRPGARMLLSHLDARFGTDPAVAAGVSELIRAGYLAAPDAETVELTDLGFEAVQRGSYRAEGT